MSHAEMTPGQRQQRAGWYALGAFALGVLGLWLASPVRQLVTEHLLPHIAYAQTEAGFGAGFGGLPELVKDQGGSQPVPLAPPPAAHAPEYRGSDWLRARPATGWALQVAVLADEQSVLGFLSGRADRDRFAYFSLPAADGATHLVLVFGQYASRADAEAEGVDLTGLPSPPLARAWSIYQAQLPAPTTAAPSAEPVAPAAAGETPPAT